MSEEIERELKKIEEAADELPVYVCEFYDALERIRALLKGK